MNIADFQTGDLLFLHNGVREIWSIVLNKFIVDEIIRVEIWDINKNKKMEILRNHVDRADLLSPDFDFMDVQVFRDGVEIFTKAATK